mmetsp:Transcript_30980/g.72696  ORF Transcript_30980/g.72696 Transcript_30980/m.72696 type:complete len:246 (+) Transcript_30980:631-1368(+)
MQIPTRRPNEPKQSTKPSFEGLSCGPSGYFVSHTNIVSPRPPCKHCLRKIKSAVLPRCGVICFNARYDCTATVAAQSRVMMARACVLETSTWIDDKQVETTVMSTATADTEGCFRNWFSLARQQRASGILSSGIHPQRAGRSRLTEHAVMLSSTFCGENHSTSAPFKLEDAKPKIAETPQNSDCKSDACFGTWRESSAALPSTITSVVETERLITTITTTRAAAGNAKVPSKMYEAKPPAAATTM